jgi:hypothetical protein
MTNLHPTSYFIRKTETISPKVRNKKRKLNFFTLIEYSLRTIRQEEEIKEY